MPMGAAHSYDMITCTRQFSGKVTEEAQRETEKKTKRHPRRRKMSLKRDVLGSVFRLLPTRDEHKRGEEKR
jgi:hypothetical protein